LPLLADVTSAIADAMRKQDAARLGALRMLKAALMSNAAARSTTASRRRW
jgi:uncharacterized protein YqeY